MRGDYDYHHATSNAQFIAILVVLCIVMFGLGGLIMGLNVLSHF